MEVGELNAKVQRVSTACTGDPNADVDAWTLPVAAARLAEWLTENERENLVSLVRKQLARIAS